MPLQIAEYMLAMRRRQELIAFRMGLDLRGSKELRILLTCANVFPAMILRVLTVRGLVTDAQLATAFDEAMAAIPPVEGPPQVPEDPPPPV